MHDNAASDKPGLAFVVQPYDYDEYWIWGVFHRLADACECAYEHQVRRITAFDLDTGEEVGEITRENKETKEWETSGVGT